MHIILFGPPASGKGTQAAQLVRNHNFVHLSTGDMLRKTAATGTALGLEVADIMRQGGLVSDALVIRMIDEALDQNKSAPGIIFDGFPRTLSQALALDDCLEVRNSRIDLVIQLVVDEEKLLERVSRRYSEEGRKDDNPDTLVRRLEQYTAATMRLLPLYEGRGCVVDVDGMAEVSAVTRGIEAALKGQLDRKSA